MSTKDVDCLPYRTVVTTFPSGARLIVTTGPGVREAHIELPYHEGDIYDRLTMDDWKRLHLNNWPPEPAPGQGESQ